MDAFDVCGALRRIRRLADLSQRELGAQLGVSKSSIAAMESGDRVIDALLLARAAALAGLRIALMDSAGREVDPMSADAVTDLSGRRFPAHLDTRRSDEGTWLYEPRRDRPETAYTFGRNRPARDRTRERLGTPVDHQRAEPGDSPRERAAARRHAYRLARAEELERRFLAGEFASMAVPYDCTCPSECDELDDWSGRPVHASECTCTCDPA